MSKKNYLDYIPVISEKNTWSAEEGVVTVHMVHRGFFAFIAQKLFHRPRVSHIKLDEMGSFIFPLLDGSRTVEVIAEDGEVTEIDCAYPDCIHRSVCPIAKQVDELSE